MPSLSSANQVQVRLNRAITGVGGAVETMQVLAKNFKAPFLEAIVNTGQSLLTIIQTVKKNKEDCAWLMEQTCSLLFAIISIQVKPEVSPDLLPPHTLNHLAKATESLHKIHGFVEAHQEKNWIKGFFQQGEMNILLKDCKKGLQQALDYFKFKEDSLFKEISKMQKYAQDTHQEVLQLIEELADDANSETLSINRTLFSSHNSSTSISMLPSEPTIFHGRESEVLDILNFFSQQIPRIVILGPGGMGKTSLARAVTVLHHPQITDRFAEHRFLLPVTQAPLPPRLNLLLLSGTIWV
ncbi:hypothetical protein C8R43DRAFT_482119 [Mycena crocata]|nr:hypothetical protein C8R43DRAFT_482119 [Mycena crocata]